MVIENLTSASFQTSYYTLNNMTNDEEFEVATLFTTVRCSVFVELIVSILKFSYFEGPVFN